MADQNKWNGENPWLGLGAYNEGQHLYGRDKETTSLTDIIVNHTASVVYGKSGIGKSSLLRAGVFPQIRQRRFVPIYLRLAHNTDVSYSLQIENAIKENVIARDILPSDIPELGLWDYLHRHRFTDTEGETVTPVVVLDQFEEIFTLTNVEHKSDVQVFFAELADVLNDVKPDRVIEAEASYAQRTAKTEISAAGFTLQSLSKSTLCYEKSPSFRVVFSLRDDSLYLLERSSAKIPALKVNRYNLCALDEESAMEVITKPCPNLFSDMEAHRILDGLAYYEYDDYRVVDPAILSLFLYSYYKEQGKLAYTDIFERYYQDCTKDIKEASISYIEDHLLTERGNRNQIPTDELLASGISMSELSSLLQCKIIKTEKRKGQDYAEFSHDRLCEQALKHRDERKVKEQTKKLLKRMLIAGVIFLAVASIAVIFLRHNLYQNRRYLTLEERNFFCQNEKDSIQLLNDSLTLLNDLLQNQKNILIYQLIVNSRQKDSLNNQLRINGVQNDSLKHINIELERNLKIISEQQIQINKMRTIMAAYNACIFMRDAIVSNDTDAIRRSADNFKKLNISFFHSLRCRDNEQYSLNGHMVFHDIFALWTLDGIDAYKNADKIESLASSLRNNFQTSVTAKTCLVKANKSTKLYFYSIGHQEIAVITEPGGSVTMNIHVTNNDGLDEWFNDTSDVKKGRPQRMTSFDLPKKTNKIELEIFNCTNRDISFAVISN